MSHISHTDNVRCSETWQTKRSEANKTVNVFPKICLPNYEVEIPANVAVVVVGVAAVVVGVAAAAAAVACFWLIHANLFGN